MDKLNTFHSFYGPCTSSIFVSTTGPCGGDVGHGAHTRLVLQDEGGSCWAGNINLQADACPTVDNVRRFVIDVFGDVEQSHLLAALEAAARDMRAAGVLTEEELEESREQKAPHIRLVQVEENDDEIDF
jgi:hypothetical protein